MTILSIIIALVALSAAVFLWVKVERLKADLTQIKSASPPSQRVELALPDSVKAPPTDISPEPVSGNRIILGYRNDTIVIENQPDGANLFTKEIAVEIPKGTTDVIPVLSGYDLFFGVITKVVDPVSGIFSYGLEDTNFSFGLVNLRVVKIGGVTEFGTVTATLQLQVLLRDRDGEDEWAGWVHF